MKSITPLKLPVTTPITIDICEATLSEESGQMVFTVISNKSGIFLTNCTVVSKCVSLKVDQFETDNRSNYHNVFAVVEIGFTWKLLD